MPCRLGALDLATEGIVGRDQNIVLRLGKGEVHAVVDRVIESQRQLQRPNGQGTGPILKDLDHLTEVGVTRRDIERPRKFVPAELLLKCVTDFGQQQGRRTQNLIRDEIKSQVAVILRHKPLRRDARINDQGRDPRGSVRAKASA